MAVMWWMPSSLMLPPITRTVMIARSTIAIVVQTTICRHDPIYPRCPMAATTSDTRKTHLAEQRRTLPDGPGVYLFRDDAGKVIYVGKAKSIRKRVAGHFSNAKGAGATRGAIEMVSRIHQIEFL